MPSFFVPCTPVGKARPRVVRGHAFTPERTRRCEDTVREWFRRLSAASPKDLHPIPRPTAISVTVTAFMPVPKSWSKRKAHLARTSRLLHTSRPDADNLGKLILDALNGVAWNDDSQVVDLAIHKVYASSDREPGFLITYSPQEAE